ncbi:MAG: rhodanese-like domain-containing protein [Bacteroidales bacterium]|jgi:rhodanese-related sulfurtransferase|nr:rhodanese-like domain-containing protein [Bacteroidales bacterium]
MKNTRVILAIVYIPLAFILAFAPIKTNKPNILTSDELLEEVNSSVQFTTPDIVADRIIQKDPFLQLIDVRTPEEFEKFSLPGAINIPLSQLLSAEYADLLDQSDYTNVFYSNGTVSSSQAWILTRMNGYENNYVLMGGLNYWAETIMNPEAPPSTSPDEEIAKYNFRKGASQVLGGAASSAEASQSILSAPKLIIKKSTKKKRVQGGC